MSHISVMQTEITDIECMKRMMQMHGCTDIKTNCTVDFYGTQRVDHADLSGLLPGWRYPITVKDKHVHYDFFGADNRHCFDSLGNMLRDYSKELILQHLPYDDIEGYDIEETEEETKITINF